MRMIFQLGDVVDGIGAEFEQRTLVSPGPERAKMREPEHYEQRRLAHPRVRQHEHLTPAIAVHCRVATRKESLQRDKRIGTDDRVDVTILRSWIVLLTQRLDVVSCETIRV